MDSVTAINVHRFGAGLLVELVGEEPDGEIAVRSFEFEWVDGERTQVQPVGGFAPEETRLIEDRLVAAGYEVVLDSDRDAPVSPSATRERGHTVSH